MSSGHTFITQSRSSENTPLWSEALNISVLPVDTFATPLVSEHKSQFWEILIGFEAN